MWLWLEFWPFFTLQEPWVADVDGANLRLQVALYFGSVLLKLAESGQANTLSVKNDNYGNTEYRVFFPTKFEFEDNDFTPYDVERELGAYPYCMIRVMYLIPGPDGQGNMIIVLYFIPTWGVDHTVGTRVL